MKWLEIFEGIKNCFKSLKFLASILTKKNIAILFTLTSLAVSFIPFSNQFTNFLKLLMKQTLWQKTENHLTYRTIIERILKRHSNSLGELFGKGEFALAVLYIEGSEMNTTPKFQGKYIGVASYDYATKKPVEARNKLKNNSDTIDYTYEQTKALIDTGILENGKPLLQFTEDYEAQAGANVSVLYGNYWFPTYARVGISYVNQEEKVPFYRIVLMMSKEAFSEIKNQKLLLDRLHDIHAEIQTLEKY